MFFLPIGVIYNHLQHVTSTTQAGENAQPLGPLLMDWGMERYQRPLDSSTQGGADGPGKILVFTWWEDVLLSAVQGADDGVFWIAFEDVLTFFDCIDICKVSNTYCYRRNVYRRKYPKQLTNRKWKRMLKSPKNVDTTLASASNSWK